MTTTAPSASMLRLGIIVLTVVTAMVHLYLGLSSGLPPFVLNGLGYLALLAALFLPVPQLLGFSHFGAQGVGYVRHRNPPKEVSSAYPTRRDDTGFSPVRATVLKAPL